MSRSHGAASSPDPSYEEVRGRIREFVLSTFYVPDADQLLDETSLLESGVVDSTGVLEVLGFLGRELGLRIEDSEVVPENLDSIERLTRFVRRKLDAPRSIAKVDS